MDPRYLAASALPSVPTSYAGPVITSNGGSSNPRNNAYVITNAAHSRSTNPGFTRTEGGRGYCHW